MNEPTTPPRHQRLILSGFVVLNLATVGWINMPDTVGKTLSQWLDTSSSPTTSYRMKYIGWRWQQYAHIVGLDNRWQMFGRQSRFNWWYDIRAVYSDGRHECSVLLPLPNQSARSISQRMLFDLKERKFELNLYPNTLAREAYSRYLARQFPFHNGMPIQTIRWHLGTEGILPPSKAVQQQKLHTSRVQLFHLNDFAMRHNEDSEIVRSRIKPVANVQSKEDLHVESECEISP